MKKIANSLHLLVLFFLFIGKLTIAQNTGFKLALEKYRKDYPEEKVFLQTDNVLYTAGETIWMKAWCVNEQMPTFLSTVLYIELVNDEGKVVKKNMCRLDSLSSTASDFFIDTITASGNYSINAYTLWMLNFPELIFRKNIYIYGIDNSTPGRKPASAGPVNLQFFPEGGEFVSGLTSKVGFKAITKEGIPYNFKGYILLPNKEKIPIETQHDGMGFFELNYKYGEDYTAYIPYQNAELTFNLPKGRNEGVNLKVSNASPSKIFIQLKRSEANKEKYGVLTVVAQMNSQLVYENTFNLDNNENAFALDKKKLPPGVLRITVFDANKLPIAERVTYVENYEIIKPQVVVQKKSLAPKGLNQVEYRDTSGASSLSCLITTYDPADSSFMDNTIASYLLYTSEIKGDVYNPGYYTKDKSIKTLQDLDLLFLTQGWRRFAWEKALKDSFTEIKYPVETAITFSGKVYKSDSKEPIKSGSVSFVIRGVDSTSIMADASITDKGEFLLGNLNYKKYADIYYMGTNAKRENFIVDVKLTPRLIDTLKKSSLLPRLFLSSGSGIQLNGNKAVFKKIENNDGNKKIIVLDEIKISGKRIRPEDSLNNLYATGAFSMGKSINPNEFPHYSSVWQMLQASVPGIDITGSIFDPVVTFSRFRGLALGGNGVEAAEGVTDNMSTSGLLESSGVTYFLNEVNVPKEVINTLSPSDVALIKVFKAEGAALGASGPAIAFYTKSGTSGSSLIYEKTYKKESHLGYTVPKEFYVPFYDTPESKTIPDNRYVLFWSGNLNKTRDGYYRFKFYNNDFGKKYRIIVQGLTKEGELVYDSRIVE